MFVAVVWHGFGIGEVNEFNVINESYGSFIFFVFMRGGCIDVLVFF